MPSDFDRSGEEDYDGIRDVIKYLDRLGSSSAGSLEGLISGANVAPAKRIAAILWYVSCSDFPIATSVAELICSVTDPEWDSPTVDPVDTPIGKAVINYLNATEDALLRIIENESSPHDDRAAAHLCLLSLTDNFDYSPSLNLILNSTTGRGAMWWIEWISEQRSKGA